MAKLTSSLVLGAALGECVHVAGVLNFLAAARRHGLRTDFLGPAVPVERLVSEAASRRPQVLALSYRLTPEAAGRLFDELAAARAAADLGGIRLVFGGPPPVAAVARASGLFEATFDAPGEQEVEAWLGGAAVPVRSRSWGRDLVTRWRQGHPRPLIRHHFGLPDMDRTAKGVASIAESGLVDVISLGPDQNAQEHFFHPERMDPAQDGAGGVPIRTRGDLERLFASAQTGNHPLLRCYSGTNDLVAMGEVLRDTIRNAWTAVPVFWYSELDGRSERSLEDAIAENQDLVTWCGDQDIAVERNDQNQWGLRYAHDALQVAAAAVAAGLTTSVGVSMYLVQMMLNTPPGISPSMDVAKMIAMETLVREVVGPGVKVLREARAGLFSLPADPDRALGQLASSTRTAMLLSPDVLHIVGHTEAQHAIEATELITACRVVHQVIDDALLGQPDPLTDPLVAERRDRLLGEGRTIIGAIAERHPGALTGTPEALAAVVRSGLFDAPHLSGSPAARGTIVTVVDGGCDAVDPATGRPMSERDRLGIP